MEAYSFFQKYGNHIKFSQYKERLTKLIDDFKVKIITICGEYIVDELRNQFPQHSLDIDGFGILREDNKTRAEILLYNINKKILTGLDPSIDYFLNLSLWEKIQQKRRTLEFHYKYDIELVNFDDYFNLAVRKKLIKCPKIGIKELWTSYIPVCHFSIFYLLYSQNKDNLRNEIIKKLKKCLFKD